MEILTLFGAMAGMMALSLGAMYLGWKSCEWWPPRSWKDSQGASCKKQTARPTLPATRSDGAQQDTHGNWRALAQGLHRLG